MKVAPYDACVACLRGDTTTGFGLRGEPIWFMAVLHSKIGLSPERAQDLVEAAVESMGFAPSALQEQLQIEIDVRVCSECASTHDLEVGELDGDELPGFEQPGWG